MPKNVLKANMLHVLKKQEKSLHLLQPQTKLAKILATLVVTLAIPEKATTTATKNVLKVLYAHLMKHLDAIKQVPRIFLILRM